MTADHPAESALRAFLEDELPTDEAGRVRAHLQGETACRPCLTTLNELRQDAAGETLRARVRRAATAKSGGGTDWWRGAEVSGKRGDRTLTVSTPLQWTRRHGSGGQGDVEVYRDETLRRNVAVKLLKIADVAPEDQSRMREKFARECLVISSLEHPGVVPLYGIGVLAGDDRTAAPESQPMYAMRYIDGRPLSECVREFHELRGRMTREDRRFTDLMKSFVTVCRTIRHAHERKICHADLKPQNVMVDRDVTLLIDWGSARLDEEAEETTEEELRNRTGSQSGLTTFDISPAYVPPEVAAARARLSGSPAPSGGDVPANRRRADLYGLGAILFEILTALPPHQIRAGERVGDFLARIAQSPTPTASDRGAPPRELNAICARAMSKDPARRYPDAEALASDVENWLHDRWVTAYDYSPLEKLLRISRRNAAVMIATIAGLILVLAIGGWAYQAVDQARIHAQNEELRAQNERARAENEKTQAQIERTRAEREKNRAEERTQHAAMRRHQSRMETARRAIEAGDFAAVHSLPETWDGRYLQRTASFQPQPVRSWAASEWAALDAALHPDGRRLLVAGAEGVLSLWDLQAGAVQRTWGRARSQAELRLPVHHLVARRKTQSPEEWGRCVTAVEWVADSDRLVIASADGIGALQSSAGDEEVRLVKSARGLSAAAVDASGSAVLFGAEDGGVFRCGIDERSVLERRPGTAAVSDILWHASGNQWLVADVDGVLRSLSADDLEETKSLNLGKTIRAADLRESQLAVACDTGVRLFVWNAAEKSWTEEAALHVSEPPVPLERVRFLPDGRLLALSEDGRLVGWRTDRRIPLWTTTAIKFDQRRKDLLPDLQTTAPSAFKRLGAAILPTTDPSRVLTAGDDGVVFEWLLPPVDARATKMTTTRLGVDPQVVFDDEGRRLWSIDASGDLTVLTADGEQVLAVRSAHQGTRPGIARRPRGGVATVGGDNFVRFWRFEEGEIVEATQPIRHRFKLRSIACGPDGVFLAAVDDNSQVVVWTADGSLVDSYSLGPQSSPPHTGKAAFHADGVRLAVFGSAQSGHVFSLAGSPPKLQRFPDRLWVAGPNGGTAVTWNPAHDSGVFTADDYPRIAYRSFSAESRDEELVSFEAPQSTIKALSPTADRERIVLLEEKGRMTFLDARWGLKMLEIAGSIAKTSDLAVDPTGRRIAVAGSLGELEIWDVGERRPLPAEFAAERSRHWKSVDLIAKSAETPRFNTRSIRLDSRDRLWLLMTLSGINDRDKEGELRLLTEEHGEVRSSPALSPAGPNFARRMEMMSIGLTLTTKDEPRVAVRCRTGAGGVYGGTLFVGRTTDAGDWKFESTAGGNLGFYPALALNQDGDPTDVWHFDSSFFGLLHHRRGANGAWQGERIGLQGDGMHLRHVADSAGRRHFLFRRNRFNGDSAPRGLLTWDPTQREVSRETLNGEGMVFESIALTAEDEPVILRRNFAPESRRMSARLLRRATTGWVEFQTLPITDPVDWRIGPDGAVYLLDWDRDSGELTLLRGSGERWERSSLGSSPRLSEGLILFDSRSRPVVFAAGEAVPFGWARIFREVTE